MEMSQGLDFFVTDEVNIAQGRPLSGIVKFRDVEANKDAELWAQAPDGFDFKKYFAVQK